MSPVNAALEIPDTILTVAQRISVWSDLTAENTLDYTITIHRVDNYGTGMPAGLDALAAGNGINSEGAVQYSITVNHDHKVHDLLFIDGQLDADSAGLAEAQVLSITLTRKIWSLTTLSVSMPLVVSAELQNQWLSHVLLHLLWMQWVTRILISQTEMMLALLVRLLRICSRQVFRIVR